MERPLWTQQKNHRDQGKFLLDRNESRNKNAISLTKKLLHEAIDESVCQYYDLGDTYTLIGKFLELSESNLYLTNGADGSIRYFFEYCNLKGFNNSCILMRPSYGMYEVYASQYFYKTLYIDYDYFICKDSNQFEKIIEAIKSSAPKSALIIANPESPTGIAYTKEQIEQIIALAHCHQLYLLIDCTYEAYLPSSHKLEAHLDDENIFYCKSFSKSWSFAGMRIGYLQGNSSSIKNIKLTRPMYEIGSLQAKLLEKAIKDKDQFESFIVDTINVKNNLLRSLNNIEIKTFDTYCNFIHISEKSLKSNQLARLNDLVLFKKINHRSLANLIRLTVPSRDECDIIIQALTFKE